MADRTITVGDGKTHASLNATLAPELLANPDLTTAGGVCTIECYFISGGDGTQVTTKAFTGATAANYIRIVAVDRHAGTPNMAAYYMDATLSPAATFNVLVHTDRRAAGLHVLRRTHHRG